jgi:hypothetical protein
MMCSDLFMNLVNLVVEAAREGTRMTEDLYLSILESAPATWCESHPSSVASALRKLAHLCESRNFGWANSRLDAGASPEELILEVEQSDELWKAILEREKSESAYAESLAAFGNLQESERSFLQGKRDMETLMGFDQGVMKRLVEKLGHYDDTELPGSLHDILPEEIAFPLERGEYCSAYDYRVHLLVRELAARLGESNRLDKDVIKISGHVLGKIYHSDDDAAESRLLLRQLTILADEYVWRNDGDAIGLCWRGELACWEGDDDLALDCARQVWNKVSFSSTEIILRTSLFFAFTGSSAPDWNVWKLQAIERPRWHLGEHEEMWIDRKQPLACAIVRKAFQRGTWDTSLLCSIVNLLDNGYFFRMKFYNASTEAWAWIAEQAWFTACPSETYHMCWSNAYESLGGDTRPDLAHNVIATILVGLLTTDSQRNGLISATFHQVLEAFQKLHLDGSMPEGACTALDLMSYLYRQRKLDHLTAADRVTVETAIEGIKAQKELDVLADPSRPCDPEVPAAWIAPSPKTSVIYGFLR